MLFTSGTWVTEARRDEGTTESCSIATLMKYTLLFINSFYTKSIWSEKACQVLRVKVTLVQGSTVKINSDGKSTSANKKLKKGLLKNGHSNRNKAITMIWY
jgi:hypothetical protein